MIGRPSDEERSRFDVAVDRAAASLLAATGPSCPGLTARSAAAAFAWEPVSRPVRSAPGSLGG
jgi:hypothetical protein